MISWRRLDETDFPLLRQWLRQPHVARWWHHETSPEAVARDFGPAARGEEPSEDLLILLDGEPFGLVQRYRFADYAEDLSELAHQAEIPQEAMSVDYLIGDPKRIGQGLGTRMIQEVVRATWADHPDATAVLVPVHVGNRASWRILEKAGLLRVADVSLEPDNPIDDRAHYLYRIDRPAI
ncbi:acetyltransferase [Streptomyces sp. NBC_01283]|uniref:GNAT family N-acetyltransferase n=1 Tax=Streptomyces sp. NBC_01283 TaxID=2903812 RepID=UPI00352F1A5A|nr:acetyltransferase [Streptomyces sp. NBC_01283]